MGVMAEKKDWRVGLTVRAKYRTHRYYYERGKVLEAHPDGHGGVHDKTGVLVIQLDGGAVCLDGADNWVTA